MAEEDSNEDAIFWSQEMARVIARKLHERIGNRAQPGVHLAGLALLLLESSIEYVDPVSLRRALNNVLFREPPPRPRVTHSIPDDEYQEWFESTIEELTEKFWHRFGARWHSQAYSLALSLATLSLHHLPREARERLMLRMEVEIEDRLAAMSCQD